MLTVEGALDLKPGDHFTFEFESEEMNGVKIVPPNSIHHSRHPIGCDRIDATAC